MTEVSLSIIQSRAARMSDPEAWLSEFLDNATVDGKTVYYEADSEWHQAFRQKHKANARTTGALPPAHYPPPQPVPRDKWPRWARFVETFKGDADKGVGDTVHWQLGAVGKTWEMAAKAVGLPCRCEERREQFNAMYPYSDSA